MLHERIAKYIQDKARSAHSVSSNILRRGEKRDGSLPWIIEHPRSASREPSGWQFQVAGGRKPITVPMTCAQNGNRTIKNWDSLLPQVKKHRLTSIWKTCQYNPTASSSSYQKSSFYHRQNREALGFSNHVSCQREGQWVRTCYTELTHTQVYLTGFQALMRWLNGTREPWLKFSYIMDGLAPPPQLPPLLVCFWFCNAKCHITSAQKSCNCHKKWDLDDVLLISSSRTNNLEISISLE